MVLPEPQLGAWSEAVEVGGQRVIGPRREHTAATGTFRVLPPDFAVRELLAVDPDDPEQVWAWSVEYGAPNVGGNYWAEPLTMGQQAGAIRAAQQASVFVLADLLDDPDTPAPYNTAHYLDGMPTPQWRNPAWEAHRWMRAELAHMGPFIATHPEQLDALLNYAHWDGIVAVQLYNYVSQRPTIQRCDNAPWHGRRQTPWFTVQRTDRRKQGGYGPQNPGKRVRFCSRACAKAFTERERRNRARNAKTTDED